MALSLVAARAQVILPLSRAAAALKTSRGWRQYGYACLDDFTRERYGRCGRWLADLAHLHALLERLPALALAVSGDDGGHPLHVSAALALGDVAGPASLASWIALARRSTLARLRHEIRRAMQAGAVAPLGEETSAPNAGAPDAERPGASGRAEGPAGSGSALEDDEVVLRMMVPPEVRAAFREALDLFRAVQGTDRATVTSFVEALAAECSSELPAAEPAGGFLPADVHAQPVLHLPARAEAEEARARAAGHWRHLDHDGGGTWALRLAGSTLERLARLREDAGRGDVPQLDAQIGELLALESQLELRLGEILLQMGGKGAWSRLGFESLGHYAERRLGLSRTVAEDRVWAARAIAAYPILRQAYEKGELAWEATRTVLHILHDASADEAAQRAWAAHARSATVKRLRDELRSRAREWAMGRQAGSEGAGAWQRGSAPIVEGEAGSGPDDEGGCQGVGRRERGVTGPGPTRSAPRADWRGAVLPMDDACWHAGLRREPGSTRSVMARLGRMIVRQAEGCMDRHRIEGEILRLTLPSDLGGVFQQMIRTARLALRRHVRQVPEEEPWPEPGAAASVLVTRIFSIRGWVEPAWVGLLWMLEHCVGVWDRAESHIEGKGRAEVFARSGYRCGAPGCTSRERLQDHHLEFRSAGGGDGLENRESLCVFHHQKGIHGGLAAARGRAPLGIVWRLGRTGVAEWFRNERRLGLRSAGGARGPRALAGAP